MDLVSDGRVANRDVHVFFGIPDAAHVLEDETCRASVVLSQLME